MANKSVTVLARIKAKGGMEERVKQELLALVAPTRAEAGCINYDLHQSADDPTLFMFYENWKSKEDLDQHMEMPYLKALAEKGGELFAAPVELTLWEKISS